MPREITVFLSSPGDVADERKLVHEVAKEINIDPAYSKRCVLRVLDYKTESPSKMGISAQEVVNESMREAAHADLVVCILCNRLGTPTVDDRTGEQYKSGTDYEFRSAYKAFISSGNKSPLIMLYLGKRSLPPDASDDEVDQFSLVRKYKKDLMQSKETQGLFKEYSTVEEFKKHVVFDLKFHINQLLSPGPEQKKDIEKLPVPPIELRYLEKLAEQYRWLELQGIREAGALRIELEKVYIALKAEAETDFAREQAAALHETEVQECARVDTLLALDAITLEDLDSLKIRQNYRPEKEEAKRAKITEVRTVADAFRQFRRIVIRGGPGSGKSTLGRWIVLQFARGMHERLSGNPDARVKVPLSQIDPDPAALEKGDELVDLGPARLPVFLRIAYFARELADRERAQKPTLSLIEYLGFDPDSLNLKDGCTPEARNEFIRSALDKQQAIVILDGLDELTEANRRTIVHRIEDFINQVAADDVGKVAKPPFEVGGNQVIITSRYVGYKLAPVKANCAHFGIQPMERPAVERFAQSWTAAVNTELQKENRKGIVAEDLISEIYNESRLSVRELATNPLLVTILATVYGADGQLPDQRAGVYDRVVENLIAIWLKRPECRQHELLREELLAALEPLAADMQENASSNGLIGLARIGELISPPLAHLRHTKPTDRSFHPVRDALLETIRKHVGLLAEVSRDNYQFFHRTFQEFLAARHLLADREKAALNLIDRLDDPIWREPLLLALGFVMIDTKNWGVTERANLLSTVLNADGPNALIPRAALLMVNALPDLREVPKGIVGQAAMQLLRAYTISLQQPQAVALRDQIEQAFTRLRNGEHSEIVEQQLANTIKTRTADLPTECGAAALLTKLGWFSTEIVEAFLQVRTRDQANLDWPIHRALHVALGEDSGYELNHPRLPLPMRKALLTKPELVAGIHDDQAWLWLMIALYGGLRQTDLLVQLEEWHQSRTQSLAAVNPTNEMEPPPEKPRLSRVMPGEIVQFKAVNVVHDLADAELGRSIVQLLQAGQPAQTLKPRLERNWLQSQNPAIAAEGLIGLVALGEDALPLLTQALATPPRQAAAQAALTRFSYLKRLLQEPLIRSATTLLRTIPDSLPESQQLHLMQSAMESVMAAGSPPMLLGTLADYQVISAQNATTQAALDAEFWSYFFSGTVEADSSQQELFKVLHAQPWQKVLEAWSAIDQARNHLSSQRLPWSQAPLPPRVDTPVQQYLAMLDALGNVPQEFNYRAGYVLGYCRPILEDHRDLLWETFALVWSHTPKFWEGYQAGAARQTGPDELYQELRANFDATPPVISMLGEWNTGLNPYLGFRAEWRYGRDVRGGLVQVAAIGLIDEKQIPDPHERIQAVEQVLRSLPITQEALRQPLQESIAQITDVENRVRSLARLALLGSSEQAQLLSSCQELIPQIHPLERRAITIREMRTVWGDVQTLRLTLDELARGIADPWLQAFALGRTSQLVQRHRAEFAIGAVEWRLPHRVYRQSFTTGSLPWGLLYLHAMASESGSLGSSPASGEGLWNRLFGSERRQAVAALVEAGLESGLSITAREASILDRVIQAGHGSDLEPLWPLLEQPDPGAMAVITRWNDRTDLPGLWANLVQAEAERRTPSIIERTIDVLMYCPDRMHHRAAQALHGTTVDCSNPNRRWSARRVGRETLEVLASRALQFDCLPQSKSSLFWVHHDIHLDDEEVLKHWLQEAEANSNTSSPAHWHLQGLESIEPNLVPLLLERLEHGPSHLQSSLLKGLIRTLYCSKNLNEHHAMIRDTVKSLSSTVRNTIRPLRNGPITVIQVIKSVLGQPANLQTVQQIQKELQGQLIWLDDVCLAANHAIERMREIGGQQYIRVDHFWENTRTESKPLAENLNAMKLLLDWLAVEYSNSGSASQTAHILTATNALADHSPDAFGRLADPAIWEPIFTEWAITLEHWTGRVAAVRLLGKLRRVTNRVVDALKAAMRDVSYVQDAAFEVAKDFRQVEGDLLPELLMLLNDPSASVAAATAKMVTGIARASGTAEDRRRILKALQAAVTNSTTTRPIHKVYDDKLPSRIEYVDRLDRVLYQAIFEISGL